MPNRHNELSPSPPPQLRSVTAIWGFGALRSHVTSIVSTTSFQCGQYVVCFDITPIVVYVICNCTTADEFALEFTHRMRASREIRFLRKYPPYALCYTLNNKSPRAKRETQIARMIDSNPVVNRMTVTSYSLTADKPVMPVRVLRICDVAHRIREILFREFVLTQQRQHRRGLGGSSESLRSRKRFGERNTTEGFSWSSSLSSSRVSPQPHRHDDCDGCCCSSSSDNSNDGSRCDTERRCESANATVWIHQHKRKKHDVDRSREYSHQWHSQNYCYRGCGKAASSGTATSTENDRRRLLRRRKIAIVAAAVTLENRDVRQSSGIQLRRG